MGSATECRGAGQVGAGIVDGRRTEVLRLPRSVATEPTELLEARAAVCLSGVATLAAATEPTEPLEGRANCLSVPSFDKTGAVRLAAARELTEPLDARAVVRLPGSAATEPLEG